MSLGRHLRRAWRDPAWLPHAVATTVKIWRLHGFWGVLSHVDPDRFTPERSSSSAYRRWNRLYRADRQENARGALAGRAPVPDAGPFMSILLVADESRAETLDAAVGSALRQAYPRFELCIAIESACAHAALQVASGWAQADTRVRVIAREGAATTAELADRALQAASGDVVVMLGADGVLTEDALCRLSVPFIESPRMRIVYADEDCVDMAGFVHSPRFKCCWNPELLLSMDMVSNPVAISRHLAREAGGFRAAFSGAEQYDLVLRCSDRVEADQIAHVPVVLYRHRSRRKPVPSDAFLEAGARAIVECLERRSVAAAVTAGPGRTWRVRYALPEPAPFVSIVIPTRDALALLRTCVDSIRRLTDYPCYELLIVDNGSAEPATIAYLDALRTEGHARILRDDGPFNFAALNNRAVAASDADVVVLLNNDVEVVSPGWLREMVSIAMQSWAGAVGARLWYPDGTLQHGGVVLGYGGGAGHAHKYLRRGNPGSQGRAEVIQDYSAVTAACMAVKRERYLEVEGLDAVNLAVGFNDVDFCLRLRERGYRNVWTPFAELYHHESATRGSDDTPERRVRFERELAYIQKRWAGMVEDDPAYSPNLTLAAEDFSLAWPPRATRGSRRSGAAPVPEPPQ